MIPIKILCACGQKYAFDVEPSRAAVSVAVQCPVCGADGSEAATQIISQHLATDKPHLPGLQIRGHAPSPTSVPNSPAAPPMAPPLPKFAHGPKPNVRKLAKAFAISAVLILILVAAGMIMGRMRAPQSSPSPSPVNMAAGTNLPDSPEALNAWYVEPPPGSNAATANLRAFSALHLTGFKLPPPSAPMRSLTKSTLQALVDSNQAALDLLHEGAKHQQSRYPLDLTQGFEALLPHLIKFKEAGLLAEYSATLHAEKHEGKEAAEDVLAALALGRSLQTEPVLLSHFIRAANIPIAIGALEHTLNRTVLPAAQVNALVEEIQRLERNEARGESFNRALIGERATALSIMRDPGKHLKKITDSGTAMKPKERDQWIACLKNATNFKEEVRYYEDTFHQLMAAREKPFPARLQADRVVRQRADEAKSHGMAMNDFLMPGRADTSAREAGCVAYFRLGLTALALEQFHATHGKQYPPSLSELPPQASPDAFKDPFDGQPLRYERKAQGYVLYSIGPDLNDDGGERTHGKDLVFEVGGFADGGN